MEGTMPRLRKDQNQASEKDRFSVLVSIELVDALNRMADAKGVSRNALITQLLTKAAKKYIEERA
jgi:predicted HicB family RNase H-like nuclease